MTDYFDSVMGVKRSVEAECPECEHKFPVAVTNSIQDYNLVPQILEFYGCEGPYLDMTYGKGRFWKKGFPEGKFMGIDLLGKPEPPAPQPPSFWKGDHRHTAIVDGAFNTVIYDPPHIKRNIKQDDENALRQSVQSIYNLASWDGTFHDAIVEANRVLAPGGILIIKVGNELMRHPWNHYSIMKALYSVGLKPFDEVVKLRQPSIRNPAQKQHRARKVHSYFIIVKKGKQAPKKKPKSNARIEEADTSWADDVIELGALDGI